MSDVKSIKDINKEALSVIINTHRKNEEVNVTDVDLRQKFDIGKHGQAGMASVMKGATVKYR